MQHIESKLQSEIVRALQCMQDVYIFSVPNEAAGINMRRQAMLKSMGLKSGVADLIVLLPGRVVFLEVKCVGQKQSASQVEFERLCHERGIPYYVVRSVEDSRTAILKETGGLRTTGPALS